MNQNHNKSFIKFGRLIQIIVAIALLTMATNRLSAQGETRSDDSIDALDKIIEKLMEAEKLQWANLSDLSVKADLIERHLKGSGEVKEEKRFDKEVFFKKVDDTSRTLLVYERYLTFSKKGEPQDQKELQKEVDGKIEKLKKGRGQDKSKFITDVFLAKYREFYDFRYDGVTDSATDGIACHVIQVTARKNKDDLKQRINGVFYVDTVSYFPLRIDFSPAKFPGNMMFKFKKLVMTLRYTEALPDIWLPSSFHLEGKAKAGLFFNVNFSVDETYHDYQINTGLPDSLFSVPMGL